MSAIRALLAIHQMVEEAPAAPNPLSCPGDGDLVRMVAALFTSILLCLAEIPEMRSFLSCYST
jgi:hypothetical protein